MRSKDLVVEIHELFRASGLCQHNTHYPVYFSRVEPPTTTSCNLLLPFVSQLVGYPCPHQILQYLLPGLVLGPVLPPSGPSCELVREGGREGVSSL